MEVATDSEKLNQERVFRIENLDVLNTLGLSRRSGFRYSASEIRKNLDAFQEQVHRAQDVDPKHRDTFQHKLLETARKFSLYMKLYNSFHPQAVPHARRDSR
jgi:hypothetical protein